MSTDRTRPVSDFDRLANAWLAEGPAELADRVLADALREVHLTHQRRRTRAPWSGPFGPRRFTQMSIFTKALVGLAAALLVIVGGASLLGSRQAIGGPSPSPAATPRQLGSPMPEPPLDRMFTSPIYDFVVHYPSAWRTIPATHPWTKTINSASDIPFWGDTALDALQGSDIRLVVWAQPIPQATGLTQAQAADLWVRNLHIGNGPCVGDSELPPSFAAGGGRAYTIINGCGPSTTMGIVRDGVMYEVAVVLDGVGWDFTFDGRVDAPYALAVLNSVSLPSGGLNVASPAPTTSPGA